MAKYPTMPGASMEQLSNKPVTSKFDRMHGVPRKPGEVSKPGGTAPIGTAHSSGESVSDGRKMTPPPVRHIPYSNPGQQVRGASVIANPGKMLGGQNPTSVSGRDPTRTTTQRGPDPYPVGRSVPYKNDAGKVTRASGAGKLDQAGYLSPTKRGPATK